MTQLRLTRRRALASIGALGVGAGGVWAVPPRSVSASLSTYDWVLSVGDRGPRSVPHVADLDPAARSAVQAALDGRYESTDPPAAVRRLFHLRSTTYVRTDGVYYRLDPTFPIYEVWLEPVSKAEAEDPITFDELEQCTHPDPRGIVPPPRGRKDYPERLYYLSPRVRSCIQDHPYVELGDGNYYRYHIDIDDPGEPYSVEATRVSAKTVANIEGAVIEWADVAADARELLLAAERDTLERQTIPESLRELAAEYEYVRRDGRFYEVELDHAGAAPVRVETRVIDAESREFDPAWLELSVTNTGNREIELFTGPPASLAPFGILWGEHVDGGGRILLWSQAYVESSLIGTRAGRVTGVAGAGVGVTVAAGETRTARYAVRRNPSRLKRGVYRGQENFGVSVSDENGEMTYSYELEVRIE